MGDQYVPPSGPLPSPRQDAQDQSGDQYHVSSRASRLASNNPLRDAHMDASQGQPLSRSEGPPAYQPAIGSLQSWSEKKQPLPKEHYGPPAGPPLSSMSKRDYEPPAGSPPSHQVNEPEPPPYDPWLAVPDNALLPPPPSIREERSPTANATYDNAARGHTWCRDHALWQPRPHNSKVLSRMYRGDIRLTCPPKTDNVSLDQPATGKTHVRASTSTDTDLILLSDIRLYAATSGQPRIVYFELRVLSMGGSHSREGEAGIAIGFVAPPYPTWRLPGWHRASLGVHGDDGRRYVDDSYGGKDFTAAFSKGDVVGIGISFSPPPSEGGKNRCDIFFTRNGKRDASWDLHEEKDRDAEEGDVFGLEGEHDLLAAVGCFGVVGAEVMFRKEDWMFRS